MTIHELYNKRQQEYQTYLVEKGIYEDKLKNCREQLNAKTTELLEYISTVSDEHLTGYLDQLSTLLPRINNCNTSEEFSELYTQLSNVANGIEEYVREVLE